MIHLGVAFDFDPVVGLLPPMSKYINIIQLEQHSCVLECLMDIEKWEGFE